MLERGDAVRSASGRDKGLLLCVVGAGDGFVYVCNGKARPLDNPKRKNPKHLAAVNARLSEAEMASDRALRKALAILKEQTEIQTGGN